MAALSLIDPETKTEEEYSIVHFQYKTNDRSIKKIPIGNFYKQTLLSPFNFRQDYKIITVEKNLSLKNESKDIYLLSRDDIRSYHSKYKFLHIGLVQFSMMDHDHHDYYKPASSSVSVRLRDSKYQSLQDSILVSFESQMVKGAVKFNWFPNFSTSLSDLANYNGLVVTIEPPKTQREVCINNKLRVFKFKVRYRMCYKLMKTSLKPDYLFKNPMVEVNTEITNFVVPQI
jgi:hypothetical protein